jgi:D-3-phosphoglycerate dehydrogenase / 2-oxoglutarate reductase
MKGNVVISSRSFSSGNIDLIKYLKEYGLESKFVGSKHELNELKVELKNASAWIAGTSKITDEMMGFAPELKIIARYGVGFEGIDLSSAKSRKIVVTNTPGANSLSVAELTLGLTFAALRGIVESAGNVRNSNWQVTRGFQLEGSRIGIIGFGRIGRLLAQKFRALGCDVWIFDPFIGEIQIIQDGFHPKTLDEIAKFCSIVSINAPGDVAIIDSNWLANCQDGQIIINSARAQLVDENAIANGLRSGKLFAYAADILQGEANSSASPLLKDDIKHKVTITAHVGSQTQSAIDAMGKASCDNLIAVLSGKPPINPVQ